MQSTPTTKKKVIRIFKRGDGKSIADTLLAYYREVNFYKRSKFVKQQGRFLV